jgi:DNA-binding IscR family transcriptional regulator
MLIPKGVDTSLRILDVLKRADCDYVPHKAVVMHVNVSYATISTLLYRMAKQGIIESKKGPLGGYKFVSECSVYDLYMLSAPSELVRFPSVNEEVNAVQRRFVRDLQGIIITP